ITSDFDTFLKLLTTQIRNQDPLNPVSAEDFATQLATFSGVEQQVRGNELLEGIAARLGGDEITQLAAWVGLEVRAPVSAKFSGAPVTVHLPPHDAAEGVQLAVLDAAGARVETRALPPGGSTAVWPGTTATGATAPEGFYRFELELLRDGQVVAALPAEVFTPVREARTGPEGALLLLAGGEALSPAAVTALRQPG
ncbi:MAG: hypothetical protein CVT80_02595, partial [Alphaproteobacteria bacterium HGW-Alphaproteobacteria-2]